MDGKKRYSVSICFRKNKVKPVSTHCRLLQASEEVVVLHLEDVLPAVLVHRQPGRPRRHLGLGGLLLRHERGPRGRFGNLDSGQAGFLRSERRRKRFYK